MRAAFVYRNFNMSGSLERDAVLAARALAARGVELHCYCNPASSDAEVPGAVFHDIRPLVQSRSRVGYPTETATFAFHATRALRRDRKHYDVIDVRGPAAWEHDVVTVHGVTKAQQRRWLDGVGPSYRAARLRAFSAPVLRPRVGVARSIERLQFRDGRYLRVVAVTESVARDLVAVHGIAPDRIEVVHLPIDLSAFGKAHTNTARSALGIDPAAPLLLFVGSDFERKGLAEAVEALIRAPAAHLLVVGGGTPDPFLRLARRLGVHARVHFVGRTSEPERYFLAADVFVLPTKEEPWGLTLIEAMAAGIPAVASDAAGAASIVREARAGIIVPAGDRHAFQTAILRLLDDPELRRELGDRGRVAARQFGPEAHADILIGLYERVIREREQRRA